jgi:ABC-type multidrug transport system permease subunit
MHHDTTIESSAPRRNRVNTIRIGVGLFGAPVAWIAQVFLSEPLAAHACYPYQVPVSAPIWEGLPAILIAISIACFAVALLSGFVAWTLWRQSEPKPIEEGREDIGTNRFLAKLSAMSSFIFIVAIIFNICAVFLVPPCSSWF